MNKIKIIRDLPKLRSIMKMMVSLKTMKRNHLHADETSTQHKDWIHTREVRHIEYYNIITWNEKHTIGRICWTIVVGARVRIIVWFNVLIFCESSIVIRLIVIFRANRTKESQVCNTQVIVPASESWTETRDAYIYTYIHIYVYIMCIIHIHNTHYVHRIILKTNGEKMNRILEVYTLMRDETN